MNLFELQADLRHFVAERDWQPLHTPKNLSTALLVEAAELAQIFQWMTPQESQRAAQNPASKQRIGEEVADVLLYLLQVADHCQIDIAHAVKDKLARNAVKYPARRAVARVSPTRAAVPGTHVLLDYENVQPTEDELRTLVPGTSQVWVFHGPHQRQVQQRFASFGAGVTAVPISKTGKNALDFHLSFYMGYIASRNPASSMVILANDKGYGPMLEHAKALGFAVRQQGYGQIKPATRVKAKPSVKADAVTTPAAKKVAAKKAPAKGAARQAAATPSAVQQPVARKAPAAPVPKKRAAKKAASVQPAAAQAVKAPAAGKLSIAGSADRSTRPAPAATASAPPGPPTVSADLLRRITDNLQKLGDKRPGRPLPLRRILKSLLGAEPGDVLIEVALGKLMEAGVIAIDAVKGVTYPRFANTAKPSAQTPPVMPGNVGSGRRRGVSGASA